MATELFESTRRVDRYLSEELGFSS